MTTPDRRSRFEIQSADHLVFLAPEFDKGITLLTDKEAERYLALDEWAQDRFGDDPRIFLDDGYAPRARWYRLEHAYRLWVEAHPEDEQEFPDDPPFDLDDRPITFG